jgi:type IV pilus assembly protein PilA
MLTKALTKRKEIGGQGLKFLKKNGKGFTLIELLIVVAILGILAAVIIPNVATFMNTGKLNAARTEVENVKTAALAYFADHSADAPLVNGGWPSNQGSIAAYVSATPKGTYTWSDNGTITGGAYAPFTWNAALSTWK